MSLKDLIDGLLSLCIMRFTDFYCVTCGSIEILMPIWHIWAKYLMFNLHHSVAENRRIDLALWAKKECTDPESNRGRVEFARWQRLSIPLTHQCLLLYVEETSNTRRKTICFIVKHTSSSLYLFFRMHHFSENEQLITRLLALNAEFVLSIHETMQITRRA